MPKQIVSKNLLLLDIGSTPTAANVITTQNDVIVNPKPTSEEYKDAGTGAGATKTYTNPDLVVAEFDVDVTGRASGAAGVRPACAALLKLSGLKETVQADTSVTYTPALEGLLGTAKAYVDGEYRNITGIAGNCKIEGEIGKLAKFTFSLKGFTTLSPTLEANPTVTLDANEKLLITQATVITESGTAVDLKKFELDFGMELEQHYGGETKEYITKDFKPKINIKAIKSKGNNSYWEELNSNTIKEIIILMGEGAGNEVEIKASYCNPSDVKESDDKGIMVFEKTYLCEANTGGDNFSITYK